MARFALAVGLLVGAAVAVVPAGGGSAAELGLPIATEQPVTAATLGELGIEADAEGIAAYLEAVDADYGAGGRVAVLIESLGDPDYRARRQATVRLAASPAATDAALKQASASHPDPEVRLRARSALQRRRAEGRPNPVRTVFRYVADRGVAGVASVIVRVWSRTRDPMVWPEAFYAVAAGASADERGRLRALAASDLPPSGKALARLGEWVGGERAAAAPGAREALDHRWPHVRLAAGWALARWGERAGLGVMVDLLDHESVALRRVAIQGLRSATGRRMGYAARAEVDQQREAIAAWGRWVAEEAATAEVKSPRPPVGAGRRHDRMLVADFQRNAVLEYDRGGKLLWRGSVNTPYGVHGLANGHRLVGSFNDKAVYEFDESGEVVWKKEGLPGGAMGVQRLDNGNTLIACSDAQMVQEVNQAGRVIWEAEIGGRPTQAQRLGNKRTLVCLSDGGRVVEVDPAGRVVWSIDGLRNPQSAFRTGRGHTLVCLADTGEVVEYDARKRAIRRWKGLAVPLHAEPVEGRSVLVIEQRRGVSLLQGADRRSLRIDLSAGSPVLARFDLY